MIYSIVTLIILIVMIATADVTTPPNGMDEEQLKFIADVNDLRHKFAEKYKIQNMQMLIWSKELQDPINESMNSGNLAHYSERNWRLVHLNDYQLTIRHINGQLKTDILEDSVKNIENSNLSDVYHGDLELFNSHQNEIGCARFNSAIGFIVTCLIGPKSELAPAPRYQSDQPKCTPPLKFDEVIGLCTSSDFYPDSSQLMFISVLNEKRRQFAKQHNISNMHELTWSKEQKTAETFINVDYVHPASYRIMEFKDYSSGLKLLHNARQKVEIKIAQELIHPSQTEIACVEKKDGSIMCLLGPKESYDPNDFHRGEPGSKCNEGYVNKDGLCCKRDPPATLPTPPTSRPTTITVEPVQQSPPTTQPPPNSDDGTCPTRFTTEKVTPEPPPTHPPELADYEEIDGDEYDEDFPTGSPPSQNGYWYNGTDRCGGGGLGRWILILSLFVFLAFV